MAVTTTMERVPFAKTLLAAKGGDHVVELFASRSATVLDLQASVGSDAVWLKDREEELGELLEPNTVLRAVPLPETKILSIIQSCKRGERPGDSSQVEVRPK
jgi:hypothetical protein